MGGVTSLIMFHATFLFTTTYLTAPHITRLREIGGSPTVYPGEVSMDIG